MNIPNAENEFGASAEALFRRYKVLTLTMEEIRISKSIRLREIVQLPIILTVLMKMAVVHGDFMEHNSCGWFRR